jgi:hypothetical protein
LPLVDDDPRNRDGRKLQKMRGKGMNTESFDPNDTIVRPDLRVLIGPNKPVFDRKLKHDDVVIVPNFFCEEDDLTMYYELIKEMREEQSKGTKDAEFISWHEGSHLIVKVFILINILSLVMILIIIKRIHLIVRLSN